MNTLRDYFGIGLVLAALVAGAVLAFVVGGAAGGSHAPEPPRATAPGTGPALADLALGDRDAGRALFRLECQDCHTQGRQSFNAATRERLPLVQTRIREGVSQMPAYPTSRLSAQEMRDLLAYIGTPSHAEPTPTPEPTVRGLRFENVEASGQPGQAPTVRFRIRDDAGATLAPSDLTALFATVAGPTTDYQWYRREDARRAETQPDGSARYTFSQPLPAEARGTYGAALEGYIEHRPAGGGQPPLRDTGANTVGYFAVTDPAPVVPRQVVRTETCNNCHGTLALHGGSRRNVEFCVMCHNVNESDAQKRATAGGPLPPEPVLFSNLIHRIHTGEDLHHPFVIYGGPPANPVPIDLAAIHPFPADRANCTSCHSPGSYDITPALERASPMNVRVGGEIVRQVPPVTATCLGCHDSNRTRAHAATATTALGVETCATCHGPGRQFSVTTVHRLPAERERPPAAR